MVLKFSVPGVMSLPGDLKLKNTTTTVFTTAEIQTLLNIPSVKQAQNKVAYAISKGYLRKLKKDLFVYDNNYSKLELGNKFRSPSYISLYTVLAKESVIFQPYQSIFLVSNRSEEIEIDGQNFIYRKIKDEILLNPLGIVSDGSTMFATKERALLDKIYLDGEEFFDNLRSIDWNFIAELNSKVYRNNKKIISFISKNAK